jgi:lipoprotein-releasing system ATP-binding protein
MTDPKQPALQLQDICKSYVSATGLDDLAILRNVSMTVEQGDSISIIGPSGCGKSTLLNLMGTLDQPDSGKILFDGRDLAGMHEDAAAEFRNRHIGFIFQAHHLLPQCSALENVLVPTLAGTGRNRQADPVLKARKLLERVGLTDRMHHRPGSLSGGECQRVAVARALINNPDMLLADEPTGLLDRENAEKLVDLLLELNREDDLTLIMVTHADNLARLCKKFYSIRDGQLLET